MSLEFRYSALAIFKDKAARRTELRVILLDCTDRDIAFEQAEELMRKYANDFDMEFCKALAVYEAGSDMLEDYGEIFSFNWDSDSSLDDRFNELLDSCD